MNFFPIATVFAALVASSLQIPISPDCRTKINEAMQNLSPDERTKFHSLFAVTELRGYEIEAIDQQMAAQYCDPKPKPPITPECKEKMANFNDWLSRVSFEAWEILYNSHRSFEGWDAFYEGLSDHLC